MKIWLPVVFTGGGSDVSTRFLAQGLRECGHEAIESVVPHAWQYCPSALRLMPTPTGLDAIITPSWFGLGFDRKDVPLIIVERLFTPDKESRDYRSLLQTIFHELIVRYWVQHSYRRAAAVVAMSEASRRQMVSVFPGVHPHVIPSGVDLDLFRPPVERQRPNGRPVRLLFAGNLIRRKGVDLLAPIMNALGPGFELHYTSGLRTSDILADVPNAKPLGRLNIDGMVQAYWDSDLLLLPSRHEGMPRVVMEAAACGLPAIVSDASSLPEVVVDGVTGRVCKSNDVDDFVAAIRDAVSDQGRLLEMGKASRRHAEQKYDLGRMARQYVTLIEQVSGGTCR